MESSNTSDNYPQDNKPDWRDFATQAQDSDNIRKMSPWGKAVIVILLISAIITVLLFTWLKGCQGLDGIGPIFLLIINFIVTILAITIGSVANIASKKAKSNIASDQPQEKAIWERPENNTEEANGQAVEETASVEGADEQQVSVLDKSRQVAIDNRDVVTLSTSLSVLLLIPAIVSVLIFPFAFIWGDGWGSIKISYALFTTFQGAVMVICSIVALSSKRDAVRRTLIAALFGSTIIICLDFLFLLPMTGLDFGLLDGAEKWPYAAYILLAIAPLIFSKFKAEKFLTDASEKAIIIIFMIFSAAALLAFYLSPVLR